MTERALATTAVCEHLVNTGYSIDWEEVKVMKQESLEDTSDHCSMEAAANFHCLCFGWLIWLFIFILMTCQ